MPEIVVRAMVASDLARVVQMMAALSQHHGDVARMTEATLARDCLGPDPWARIMVAKVGGALAGYMALKRLAWLHYGDRGLEVDHLFVAPEARRQGVGRALLVAASAAARAAGCVELKVGTHPDNLAVVGYYLAQGFERQAVTGARFRLYL